MRRCSRRLQPRSFETIIKGEDGKKKNIKIFACAIQLEDGEKVVEMVVKDITREKKMEADVQTYIMQLEFQSNYDALTNLANTRSFRAELKKEHERAKRSDSKYSILFMDIDNFKNYNDTNGHDAGDKCLAEVAKLIKESIRIVDFAARYGGEEFVVICPNTDVEGAAVLAEKIRATIAGATIEHMEKQPKGHVSVSIGVAEYPKHAKDAEEIVKMADEALYTSKDGGRNKVSVYSPKLKKVS